MKIRKPSVLPKVDRKVISRREFVAVGGLASTVALGTPSTLDGQYTAPEMFSKLRPLGDRVHPITNDEFHARLLHAQELMGQLDPKFDALLLGPGSGLYYFTGIRWYLSERLLAAVIPRSGQPILVSPGFEEGRMRELMKYPMEVRVWQEDESPTKLIAGVLAQRGIRTGRVGIEERFPFTYYDHFRAAAPGFEIVSADPITIACRGKKSAHEIELMRLASEATIDVYRVVFANLKEGMSQEDIANLVMAGFSKMKLRGEALVLLGASAALPHGTLKPQKLKEGDVVLVD